MSTNTGHRDHKGRAIHRGPRGGLHVITESGGRARPSFGRESNRAARPNLARAHEFFHAGGPASMNVRGPPRGARGPTSDFEPTYDPSLNVVPRHEYGEHPDEYYYPVIRGPQYGMHLAAERAARQFPPDTGRPLTARQLRSRAAWYEERARAEADAVERARRNVRYHSRTVIPGVRNEGDMEGVREYVDDARDSVTDLHAARGARNYLAAQARIARAEARAVGERHRAASTIQRAYRHAAASPHTQLGRRRILRDGGFDPENHPHIVHGHAGR